jgi:hypothetical protein
MKAEGFLYAYGISLVACIVSKIVILMVNRGKDTGDSDILYHIAIMPIFNTIFGICGVLAATGDCVSFVADSKFEFKNVIYLLPVIALIGLYFI